MNFGNNDRTRRNISNAYSFSQPWMDPIACFWGFPTIGEREGKYLTRCILESLALLRVVHFVAEWIAFSPPTPASHPHPSRPSHYLPAAPQAPGGCRGPWGANLNVGNTILWSQAVELGHLEDEQRWLPCSVFLVGSHLDVWRVKHQG